MILSAFKSEFSRIAEIIEAGYQAKNSTEFQRFTRDYDFTQPLINLEPVKNLKSKINIGGRTEYSGSFQLEFLTKAIKSDNLEETKDLLIDQMIELEERFFCELHKNEHITFINPRWERTTTTLRQHTAEFLVGVRSRVDFTAQLQPNPESIPLTNVDITNASQNLSPGDVISEIVLTADAPTKFYAFDLPDGLSLTSDGTTATISGVAPDNSLQFTITAVGTYGGVPQSKVVTFNIEAATTRYEFSANTENIETGSSGADSLRIPIVKVNGTALIEWGDGTLQSITTPGTYEHIYQTSGVKNISIQGSLSVRYNNDASLDKLKVLEISGVSGLEISTTGTYYGCSNMTWTTNVAPTITTNNLSNTFRRCFVFKGDITGWPVSMVISIGGMFYDAYLFNTDISNWPFTSLLTGVAQAFRNAYSFNRDINWNLSAVNSLNNFLRGAGSFNKSLGHLNVQLVGSMFETFSQTNLSDENYNATLSGWVSQITNGDWTPQSNVTVTSNSNTATGEGLAARTFLIDNYNWIFNDATP